MTATEPRRTPPRPRSLGYTSLHAQEGLRETLRLMADGYTNRRIAGALGLSENTVKCRVRALFRDLDARSRAHAVALGIRTGMLGGTFHRADCASYRPRPCDCGVLPADVEDEEEP